MVWQYQVVVKTDTSSLFFVKTISMLHNSYVLMHDLKITPNANEQHIFVYPHILFHYS